MSVPRMTNCPNCGAPIEGDKCPFCGTRLINIADLEIGDPIWLVFRNEHGVRGIRIALDHISVSQDYDQDCFYYLDNTPTCIGEPTHYLVELSGYPAKNNNGIYGYFCENPDADINQVIGKGE